MRQTAFALLLVVCGPLAAQEKEGRVPSFSSLKPKIAAWFSASTAARREKALEDLRRAGIESVVPTKKEIQWMEDLARSGNPSAPGRRGDSGLDVEANNAKAWVHVHIPPAYNPRTPAPLVVALHGGSPRSTTYEGAKEVGGEELKAWIPACDAAGAVLVAPTSQGVWIAPAGLEAVARAIGHAKETCNIDPDRIAVVGHSMGGFGVFGFAPDQADRFALAAPFIGGADAAAKLKNCVNLPFYIVIGSKDPNEYINVACRKNAKTLQDLDYDVTFKERPERAHDFIEDEFPAVLAKLQKKPRNLFAKRVCRVSGRGPWYWIEADGRIEGRVRDNSIEVEGPSSAVIHLSDQMVDLDKPVTLRLDGATKFEGKVARSAWTLLRSLHETGDWGRTFCARIDLR